MIPIQDMVQMIQSSQTQQLFESLYGKNADVIDAQKTRYLNLLKQFENDFSEKSEISFFVSPGRTEVCGNHTDHNAGRVLAAAVDLDIVAAVSPVPEPVIHIHSEGFDPVVLNLFDLSVQDEDRFTSTALVRGVCARAEALGFRIGGFHAVMSSTVPNGAGLSSSAAFEVLICEIINQLYNQGQINAVQNAQIAQFSENEHFGKPCGLMDQTTCAVGGFVFIDFEDLEKPVIEKMTFDLDDRGYAMMIVSTGGDHADLNEDYTALEKEMRDVARFFGPDVLRAVNPDGFYENIKPLRAQVNDRAILRAHHFYTEDVRVQQMADAIKTRQFNEFLDIMKRSGRSSWMYCQNCYSAQHIEKQGLSVALALCEVLLEGHGAWRVHGGGFEGTIQAVVPKEMLAAFKLAMEGVFGERSCHQVMIRDAGVMKLELSA